MSKNITFDKNLNETFNYNNPFILNDKDQSKTNFIAKEKFLNMAASIKHQEPLPPAEHLYQANPFLTELPISVKINTLISNPPPPLINTTLRELNEKLTQIKNGKNPQINISDFLFICRNYDNVNFEEYETECFSIASALFNSLIYRIKSEKDWNVNKNKIKCLINYLMKILNKTSSEQYKKIEEDFFITLFCFIHCEMDSKKNTAWEYASRSFELLDICLAIFGEAACPSDVSLLKLFRLNLSQFKDLPVFEYDADPRAVLLRCANLMLQKGSGNSSLREKIAETAYPFLLQATESVYSQEDFTNLLNLSKQIIPNNEVQQNAALIKKMITKLFSLYLYRNTECDEYRFSTKVQLRPSLGEKKNALYASIKIFSGNPNEENKKAVFDTLEYAILIYDKKDRAWIINCLINSINKLSIEEESEETNHSSMFYPSFHVDENDQSLLNEDEETNHSSMFDMSFQSEENPLNFVFEEDSTIELSPSHLSLLQNPWYARSEEEEFFRHPLLSEHSRWEGNQVQIEEEIDWENIDPLNAIAHINRQCLPENDNWGNVSSLFRKIIELYPLEHQETAKSLLLEHSYPLLMELLEVDKLPQGPLQGVFLKRIKNLLEASEELNSNFQSPSLLSNIAKCLKKSYPSSLSLDHPDEHPVALLLQSATVLIKSGSGSSEDKNRLFNSSAKIAQEFPKFSDLVHNLQKALTSSKA